MTLRAKLLAALAPLAAILVLFAWASTTALARLGSSPDLILRDNYRSVLAAERMMESLERLQEAALASATGRPVDEATARDARARFERELSVQEHNVTEPGEDVATGPLRPRWSSYQEALDALAGVAPRDRLARHFDALAPAAGAVRAAANEVLALNQDAMARKSGAARRAASRNVTLVIVATLVALALGLASSLALTARLLRPLRALSGTVRRLAEGDLEARARVDGKDEIASVATELNTMAERLAEYRQSSLGELLQAQQASQAAIDSLPDPVLVLDAAGGILSVNSAAETLLRAEGGGGTASLASLEAGLRDVVDRVRQHVLAGRGAYVPRGFEEAVRVTFPDGPCDLLPRASPLYSEEGGVSGVTLVLQDVTRLRRFDEFRNDLVATVARELGAPLRSLQLATHVLAEETVGPLGDKQAELVHAAREDCERLQSIVDDLLDLSRVEARRSAIDARDQDAPREQTS